MEDLINRIRFNVIQGRLDQEDEGLDGDMLGQPGVTELVEKAIEKKMNPKEVLLSGLTEGMQEVGRLYESGEYLIPDMLAAAECVGTAMDILEPHLLDSGVVSKGRFVIATVEGDLHDIGKNIVATMLKGAGYTVDDLGTGVSAVEIVETVRAKGAQYVGLSALLTTTMPYMKETIEMLEQAGVRNGVKILVGGAPTSEEFARKIGADAYCRDAFEAIEKLKSW